jgi:TolB-like protein/DNA-binding winged helix-turn-helix (wHTH) protein/Tfp pilus assembly protein PilF
MDDPHDVFLFQSFLFDQRSGGLFRRDGDGGLAPVPIGARALDVLAVLVERAGDVVTRDEITASVWPEMVVEDNNLNMQIASLRRTLDDAADATSCIQTVPRRGYRFVAAVRRNRQPPASVAQVSDAPEPDAAGRKRYPSARPRHQFRGPLLIWAAGALILFLAATAVWQVTSRWPGNAAAMPRLSIVVMPFANLSGDPAQQYFADGITEDLTTDLSRLADLLVISRDTAFSYQGKAVSGRRIRSELGVRYMLDGSVQRSGDQVRINAQLINTDTDTNLWAEQFDRNVGDLLDLQSEITRRIANALNVRLIVSEAARTTEHPDALDHIFRGRAAMYRPASRQNFAEAIGEYEQALALDPRSVETQSRLATALSSRLLDGMSDTVSADFDRANQLIEQALAEAPASPLAHFAKAQWLRARHGCKAAIPEYETVLAANSNVPEALGNIGRCKIYIGLLDEGVALEEQAIRLSPHDPFLGIWYFRIGQARLLQSRADEAITWLERAHNENAAFPFLPVWLAAAYGLKGDLPRASAELAEAHKLAGNKAPANIAAARATSARDFAAPGSQALLEATYLAGLRQAGVPGE